MTDKRHTVNESADKITVKTKIVRGEGTRDQDKLDVKVKGDNPEDVVETLNQTLAGLSETADNVRAIQPDAEPLEDE